MTWTLNPETGELTRPDGTVETELDGPPYTLPDDCREWAIQELAERPLHSRDAETQAMILRAIVGDVDFKTSE